jgi:hypothetical protein
MKKINLLKRALTYSGHKWIDKDNVRALILKSKKESKMVGDAQALRDLNDRLEKKYEFSKFILWK